MKSVKKVRNLLEIAGCTQFRKLLLYPPELQGQFFRFNYKNTKVKRHIQWKWGFGISNLRFEICDFKDFRNSDMDFDFVSRVNHKFQIPNPKSRYHL